MKDRPFRTSLAETADNPPPDGIRVSSFETADGVRLRYALCPSRLERTRGTVLLLHGRNEAIEKYFETVDDLTRRGYAVATFDWRGQGGSARLTRGRNGHVPSFQAYVTDLESFLKSIVLPGCAGPFAILSHSMGGAVALLAAPSLPEAVRRIVCCAPLIALPDDGPSPGALRFGTAALRLLGLGRVPVRPARKGAAAHTLAHNPLTSDPQRFARIRRLQEGAPRLFVGSPTAAWLGAATATIRRLDDSDVVARLHVPTLMITAGQDRVVSSAAAERLAWRMRSGHALALPGARHELLQEADRFREPTLAAFDSFAGGALPLA